MSKITKTKKHNNYEESINKYKKYLDIFINNIKDNNDTNLSIKYYEIKKFWPLHGSIINYFHFMTSVFIPLVLAQCYLTKNNIFPVFIVNDNFGPMLRILNELPIDVKIKCQNPKYFHSLEKKNMIIPKLFRSYDIHPNGAIKEKDMERINIGYAGLITPDIRIVINTWMNESIKKYDMDIIKKFDILIIERKINKSYRTVITPKNEINNNKNTKNTKNIKKKKLNSIN